MLDLACRRERVAREARVTRARRAERLEHLRGDRAIHVVTAELAVAAGRAHLEHAVVEVEDRDVEGATAEVVDDEATVLLRVEPVGQRGGRGLVQEAEHLEAHELRGVLGRLALGVVEVRGHRDDCGAHRAELVLRVVEQLAQDGGADLDGRHDAAARDLEPHDRALGARVAVGAEAPRSIARAAAHQALDARDGVVRERDRAIERVAADDRRALLRVVHDRGHEREIVAVANDHRLARRRDVGHDAVGRAQIDADGPGHAGSWIWRRAIVGYSWTASVAVLFGELDLVEEAAVVAHLGELGLGAIEIDAGIERIGERGLRALEARTHLARQRAHALDRASRPRFTERLAQLHDLHQERRSGLASALLRVAPAPAQERCRAREVVTQRAMRLVHRHRPRERGAPLGRRGFRVLVGMERPLQLAHARLERVRLEREARR